MSRIRIHRFQSVFPSPQSTRRGHALFLLSIIFALSIGLASAAFAQDAEAPGRIAGSVRTADGQPVSDAHVQLVDLKRHADTDSQGEFVFEDLPPGSYLLRLDSLTGGESTRRVEIVADQTLTLELILAVVRHEDEVVVTGSAVARSQLELAQPTTVLTGEELQFRLQPTLGESLAQEAGVASTSFGQGASRPVIRGIGGDRIRMLQDGVDVGDASATSPDHAVSSDPALAERIEVLRGPATLLYGSSAIGGVVNVIDGSIPTTRAESALSGMVEIGGGSVADERRAVARLDGGAGSWAWHLDVASLETDDYEIPGFAEVEGEEHDDEHGDEHGDEHEGEDEEEEIFGLLPNSDVKNRSATFGLAHFFGDADAPWALLGLSVSGFDSEYGVPGGHGHGEEGHEDEHGDEHGDEHEEEEEGEEDVRIDLERRRLDLRGEILRPFGAFQGAKFRLGAVDYEHAEIEGDAGEIGTLFFNDSLEARLELVQRRRGDLEGSFGVQFLNKELEAVGEEAFIPAVETTTWALFAFEELERLDGALRWQLGARYEHQESTNRAGLRDRTFDGFSVSLGSVWRPVEGYSIAATVARSTKLPNGEELYSDGAHAATRSFEIGDPNLEEETSLGVDLAFRKTTGRLTGELSLFQNRFDDYIYQAFTGEVDDGLAVLRYSQADAEFRGAELQARVALWERGQEHFDLAFTGDIVRAELDAGGNLPRIPPHRLGLGLHYHRPLWHAYVEVWDVADQDDLAANETFTEGYTMINAGASYRLIRGSAVYDLVLRGRNLGDEEARNHVSFLKDEVPLPGRDISLSLRATF